VQACAYNDCRHIDEPGCAVLQAVAQGEIHPQRYRSYLNIRQGQGLQPL
jgi:ribosome biogenesis GTPase